MGFRGPEGGSYINRLLLIFLVCAFIAGCGGNSEQTIPSVPLAELQAAPEQVEIGGTEYVISPSSQLYRDFFPGLTPPDGGPLAAWVFIADNALNPVPSDIQARYVYVIKGTEVWQSELSSEGRSTSDGPKWETGALVDMVVMVYHGNESYLIKASDVEIQRLD